MDGPETVSSLHTERVCSAFEASKQHYATERDVFLLLKKRVSPGLFFFLRGQLIASGLFFDSSTPFLA